MPSDIKKHTTTKGNGAGGRPEKEINQETFESLCGIQCTKQEISDVLGVSTAKLSNWCKSTYNSSFEEAFDRYSQSGKASLRRKQFKLAEKSASMAIFLGKQYLGQRDDPTDDSEKTLEKVSQILTSIRKTATEYEKEKDN